MKKPSFTTWNPLSGNLRGTIFDSQQATALENARHLLENLDLEPSVFELHRLATEPLRLKLLVDDPANDGTLAQFYFRSSSTRRLVEDYEAAAARELDKSHSPHVEQLAAEAEQAIRSTNASLSDVVAAWLSFEATHTGRQGEVVEADRLAYARVLDAGLKHETGVGVRERRSAVKP